MKETTVSLGQAVIAEGAVLPGRTGHPLWPSGEESARPTSRSSGVSGTIGALGQLLEISPFRLGL